MATGPVILPENLAIEPDEGSNDSADEIGTPNSSRVHDVEKFVAKKIEEGSNQIFAEAYAMMEKRVVKTVLNETSGNQSQAAAMLGITRGSLRNKIRTHGIEISHLVSDGDSSE